MGNSLRFGTALSVIAVATFVGGCAGPMERAGRSSIGKADLANIALGSRAQGALDRQDYPAAIDFAERAVEQSPTNATLRTFIGLAGAAAGRGGGASKAGAGAGAAAVCTTAGAISGSNTAGAATGASAAAVSTIGAASVAAGS